MAKDIIEWSNALSTGVEWQDNQHKSLVDQINKLVNCKAECLDEVIEFTKYYAATHFRDEEAMMVHYNYPRSSEHIDEHAYFTDTIQGVADQRGNDEDKLHTILTELSSWLIWHIKNSDYEQATWLKENTTMLSHQSSEFYTELDSFRLHNR